MTIALDGEPIPGSNLTVQAAMKIANDDASGTTSTTATVEAGIKAIQLNCQVVIAYKDKDQLTTLVNLARATDPNSKQVIYQIVNETANAMNMRRCRFSDNFQAKPHDNKHAWKVAFTLLEVDSIAEQAESRQTDTQLAEQQSAAADSAPTHDDAEPAPSQYPNVEKYLDKLNTWLGDLSSNDD
jgi:hypothetical protein